MAVLKVLSVPDNRLRTKAQPVDCVDDSIRRLMDDMFETMMDEQNQGVGIAANQVGVLKRVIICHFGEPFNEKPLMMANPEIISASDSCFSLTEGCLSVPEQWAQVSRPDKVKVRYLDYDNQLQEIEMCNEMSSVVQHEIDHLNGILFVDHLGPVKKKIMLNKAVKASR
jgi:peptide deformylase